jgi:hypothetical protein
MAHSQRSDFGAALTGLVVGASILFVLVFSIVEMTNAKYAHESKAESTK